MIYHYYVMNWASTWKNYVIFIGYRQEVANPENVYEEDETGQKENIYYRTAENSCQKYVFGRMYGKCPKVMLL